MIYFRLLIGAVVVLAAIYYFMVVLQCFGLVRFTEKNISFIKAILPFYYWIRG